MQQPDPAAATQSSGAGRLQRHLRLPVPRCGLALPSASRVTVAPASTNANWRVIALGQFAPLNYGWRRYAA